MLDQLVELFQEVCLRQSEGEQKSSILSANSPFSTAMSLSAGRLALPGPDAPAPRPRPRPRPVATVSFTAETGR